MRLIHKTRIFRSALVAVILIVSACGGGGGGEVGQVTTPPPGGGGATLGILQWSPPIAYVDGSSLDPVRDLNNIEIYVNSTGSFTDADSPVALVAAVDPATGQASTTFDLSNLEPFLSSGITYFVALRAEALTGLKSNFSQSAAFSF